MKIDRVIECTSCGHAFDMKFDEQGDYDAFIRAGGLCARCEARFYPPVEDEDHDPT